MRKGVVIDCCTLGILAHPNQNQTSIACMAWANNLVACGTLVRIPSVAIYESKRELLRMGSAAGVAKLDAVANAFGHLPISDDALGAAAEMWAKLRKQFGKSGTDGLRLDADVIICAQAALFAKQHMLAVTIATDNTRHFLPLVDGTYLVGADEWQNITP